ncbi:hypothetical protein EPA93_36370 [Ktedonosporobacter rubrisoli]|uniref:DUF3300 domain-containing protein n=1 Tax=Ktedonosporobacter rubrisoli TaxID=2509675 RepID=A0A4P6JZD0_KTERU|nr:hypothetical protein [Ktedonosporobacter rubrisoli]QBD81157.1 hypothetical protein EPA93_36370 [Ktedonosporobacter rubrisoli]
MLGVRPLSLRVKFIVTSFLLLLSLSCTFVAATSTVGALHNFQQQHMLAEEGDVRTIRPWMTIPYIAHSYHVPENYLYKSLQIAPTPSRHSTLHMLAQHSKRPLDQVIHEVQKSIISYRKQHKAHPHATATASLNHGPQKKKHPAERVAH